MLAPLIVKLARAEVGVEEVNGSNCGIRVNQYKAATNLPPTESWPWCAAFVDYIVKQAIEQSGKAYTFMRPTTAGAWDLINWSLEQDDSTSTKKYPGVDIKSGDIVVFTFSHTGIAVADADAGTHTVATVEGNTDSAGSREGGGVFAKHRKLSQIRARIRFTV